MIEDICDIPIVVLKVLVLPILDSINKSCLEYKANARAYGQRWKPVCLWFVVVAILNALQKIFVRFR